jgi:hypothetical protein
MSFVLGLVIGFGVGWVFFRQPEWAAGFTGFFKRLFVRS